MAVELRPDDLPLRMDLARSLVDAGQPVEAKAVLTQLIKQSADHPGAKELLDSLE